MEYIQIGVAAPGSVCRRLSGVRFDISMISATKAYFPTPKTDLER